MKIRIVNKPSQQVQEIIQEIIGVSKKLGYTIVTDEEPDIVMAVGGDGTLLKAIKLGKPVITVKAGRRGFLMDVEPNNISDALKRLKESKYSIEEYPMLEVKGDGFSSISFNEVGILADQPETIILDLSFLNTQISVEGDGILVSTPQGSTGWSLSATGNIIYGLKGIEIAFINPVLSPLKSIVLPFTEIYVTIRSKGYPQKVRVTSDGDIIETIPVNSKLVITESNKKGIIYRFYNTNQLRGVLCGSNCV
ncbi:NAD(+) kinase [Acidianus sulfidivorans JP7]|uniref:NAD(+) kinase n=1 Tax=Acidianus sulfidivorans JP7 TaxID=619593 RepID=A0A2U9IKK0_9CREN|nr:NAD(+)/NADH kinase [Acidianus sulfidivorans]AWR96551.1 NAD(+) kinase [Acidianus sulfidivorans JP7]